MKKIKQIDVGIQIVAIVFSVVYAIADRSSNFIFGYFLVGGIQIISFLVHWAYSGSKGLSPARRRYGWFLLVLAVLTLLSWAIPTLLVVLIYLILLPLLFAAPVVALVYCNMCLNELKLMHHESK